MIDGLTFPDWLRSNGVPETVVQDTIRARERKLREQGPVQLALFGMVECDHERKDPA